MKLRTRYNIYRYGLFIATLLNLFLCAYVFSRYKSTLVYNVKYISSPPPEIQSVAVSLPPSPNSLRPPSMSPSNKSAQTVGVIKTPNCLGTYSFHAHMTGGVLYFRLNGIDYREGDITSFGVVRRIFPERVYFADGDFISNLNNNNINSKGGSI